MIRISEALSPRDRVRLGIRSGFIAGAVYIAGQMGIDAALARPFDVSLRLIASTVLGLPVLVPRYAGFTLWPFVALFIHAFYAAFLGWVFVSLLASKGELDAPAPARIVYGAMFGMVVWIVDFLIIPAFIFPQFLLVNQFWNGFAAHTFFFGTVLGYSSGVRVRRRKRARVAAVELAAK